MRQRGEMTDEKRLALVEEYLFSGKSENAFEKEKGLSHRCISKWVRTFAVEGKPVLSSQAAVTDMKKDPDKEGLLQEIARLKQELRSKSIDLRRTEMARDAYERMIVLAEERYGIPIRKKSDAK
jgi:transposase-like protein